MDMGQADIGKAVADGETAGKAGAEHPWHERALALCCAFHNAKLARARVQHPKLPIVQQRDVLRRQMETAWPKPVCATLDCRRNYALTKR